MSRTDWAFDVVQHFVDEYAEGIGFTLDPDQNYPDRTTGTIHWPPEVGEPQRAVVIPRAVGFDNADRFRRWVTVDKTHWGAMTARPAGWRVFILMVGLLPDGEPWWSALYDESMLAEKRDFSEQMGGFYRFDPGLTADARIADWDKDRPVAFRDSAAVYELDMGAAGQQTTRDAGEFLASIWDYASQQDPDDPAVGRLDVVGDRMKVTLT